MSEDTSQSRKPTRTIRAGSVHGAIWETTELDEYGRTVVRHSIRITRRYKDQDSGGWKSSDYYSFPSDLADLALVAQEAYKHVRLHEDRDQPAEIGEESEPEAA